MKLLPVLILVISYSRGSGQGQIWGTTLAGGGNNLGVVFKMNADGTNFAVQKEFLFTTTIKSAFPQGSITKASDGNFYGLASGGIYGRGSFYKYDLTTFTMVHEFGSVTSDGTNPIGAITQTSNGKLYGVTANGGDGDRGILFEYDPSLSTYTKKYDFSTNAENIQNVFSPLLLASNGKLYGVTFYGGTNGTGAIFEYDPTSGTMSVRASFDSQTSFNNYINLMQASNGKIYGMTVTTLFEFDPVSFALNIKYDFDANNKGTPGYSVAQAPNGKLYGLTLEDGVTGKSSLFEYDLTNSIFSAKVEYTGQNGTFTDGGLTLASNGKLYGMTLYGGSNNLGTFFEFDPSTGISTKKKDFAGVDGAITSLALPFLAPNGKLYGTTSNGGTNNTGTFFEYDPTSSVYTKKLDFGSQGDGSNPANAMTQSLHGNLFGLTEAGGSNNAGVIFEIDPATSTFTKRADFNTINGSSPIGAMTAHSNGRMFGMAHNGGTNNAGAIYEFDPVAYTITKKVDFTGGNGNYPYGSLIQGPNGNLYGLTWQGGALNEGTLFEFDISTGVLTKRVDFDQTTTGYTPQGSLVLAANNKFYGLLSGGASNRGVLFEYDPQNSTYTKKIDFSGAPGPSGPRGSLVTGPDGKLYGLTNGGSNSTGLLFNYDPVTNAILSYSLPPGPNPSSILSSLTLSSNGKFYGVTTSGGTSDKGIIFEFDPSTFTFSTKLNFNGSNGFNPWRGAMLLIKTPQVITFNTIPAKDLSSGSLQLTAVSSSGLPVSYASSNTSVATVNGNTVTFVSVGSVNITAAQSGNISYLPATNIIQNLTITPSANTITFASITDKTLGDAPFSLAPSASSQLPVTLATTSDKITISGTQVTLVKAGRASITASQSGNNSYNAATPVTQSFCIKPSKPTITISDGSTTNPTLTSSAGSGNQWFLNGAAISGSVNASIKVTQAGVYKVQSTADDCVSAFSDDQTLIITGDLTENSPVVIFPNPTKDLITIFLPNVAGTKSATIFHVDGKQMDSKETMGRELSFQVAPYASGLYLIKIATGKSNHVMRFAKQ